MLHHKQGLLVPAVKTATQDFLEEVARRERQEMAEILAREEKMDLMVQLEVLEMQDHKEAL